MQQSGGGQRLEMGPIGELGYLRKVEGFKVTTIISISMSSITSMFITRLIAIIFR